MQKLDLGLQIIFKLFNYLPLVWIYRWNHGLKSERSCDVLVIPNWYNSTSCIRQSWCCFFSCIVNSIIKVEFSFLVCTYYLPLLCLHWNISDWEYHPSCTSSGYINKLCSFISYHSIRQALRLTERQTCAKQYRYTSVSFVS